MFYKTYIKVYAGHSVVRKGAKFYLGFVMMLIAYFPVHLVTMSTGDKQTNEQTFTFNSK